MDINQIIIGLIGGGGFTAIITVLASRKKNQTDIAQSNIDTALRLKSEAVKEYQTAKEELDEARRLINNAEERIRVANDYIHTLQHILDQHQIPYPKMREVARE